MKTALFSYLFVAVGGAIGACARYTLNLIFPRDASLFWGSLSSNVLGCLLIGIFAQLAASSTWLNAGGIVTDQYRLLFAVGFCGGFTTLSALVLEMNTLLQRGDSMLAAVYFTATMAGSFLAFFIGVQSAKHLLA